MAKNHGDRSNAIVGCYDSLKYFILNYGTPSYLELYHKSTDALLDYVQMKYEEGDAFAESILSGALAYLPKPFDPPDEVSRTAGDLWK